MPELSVIIPVYNEEKRIGSTLPKIFHYLNKRQIDYEVIVVDDGSTDQTIPIVENIKKCNLLRHAENQGKGAAVRTGVEAAQGKYILFTDADNSTPIEELDKFWHKKEQYDILIGSRHSIGSEIQVKQPWHRNIITYIGNKMIRIILGLKLKDTQCGFKIFRGEVAKDLFGLQKINRWAFDMEILYLAKKKLYSAKEIPVTWINSPESKVKPLDFFKTFGELIKIRFTKYPI
ncbi:MAG: dolichyl-phosphate beta-glucosyltransferase [Patescibacteria group bacterium]